MGQQKATGWTGLAVLSLAMGGLLGCAFGGNPSPPTPAAAISAPVAEPPPRGSLPEPPADPAPLPQEPIPAGPVGPSSPSRPNDGWDPLAGQSELSAESLVTEVELRNPSLEAASAAWRAAAERYPQAISLDDPMFGFALSPGGVGREDNGGWMVEASQKIPWSGKRALRGNAASAEADAAQADVGEARLMLDEAAKMALADYYAAVREEEVNRTTATLLKQFRQIAKSKYEVNQATEQDVFQADVELADLESRRGELLRDRQVAAARINTLLHREVDYPLPPPPSQVETADALPGVEALRQAALQCRPDLAALLARVRMEEANLELANREYWPDLEVMAKYDAFMPVDIRPEVGLNINVPLRQQRRDAAAAEAAAKLQQRRAEYQAARGSGRLRGADGLRPPDSAAAVDRHFQRKNSSLRGAKSAIGAGQLHGRQSRFPAADRRRAPAPRPAGEVLQGVGRLSARPGVVGAGRGPAGGVRSAVTMHWDCPLRSGRRRGRGRFRGKRRQPLAGWGGVCYSRLVGKIPAARAAKNGILPARGRSSIGRAPALQAGG